MVRRAICFVGVMTVFAAMAWPRRCAAAGDDTVQSSLTIYNQNFAVVRQDVPLKLNAGTNAVRFSDVTMHLEPDSVILRDPAGKHSLQVLEQNYRADPISEPLLLSLFEGKTIDFLVNGNQVVQGKIIRSGYVPHNWMAMNRYGSQYYQQQMAYAYPQGSAEQPIIEVEGKLRFGLPGLPLFPSLGENTLLKPELQWTLASDRAAELRAELSYVTGGLSWEADYNIVAPENGDTVDVIGWITMDNQSGKTFDNTRIKLMAGDVNKIEPEIASRLMAQDAAVEVRAAAPPVVTEKAFDEYHLYTLPHTTTLHDRETKQVEFIHAANVSAKEMFVYDGAKIDGRYAGWGWENIRNDRSYGTQSNTKVWIMREFMNSEANHLGIPLPKGKIRFYRRNDDGQMEFTGENMIDHTPKDETVRVYTGNVFDVTGDRRQTDYRIDNNGHMLDESFEIKLRNHKKEAVQVRVVEHLYRWSNWAVASKSDSFRKMDSRTIEFPVTIAPNSEKTVTYTVHYSWS